VSSATILVSDMAKLTRMKNGIIVMKRQDLRSRWASIFAERLNIHHAPRMPAIAYRWSNSDRAR